MPVTPKTGTESGRESAKEQKSKRAKEQKIGRDLAGPGRAGVLRIETDGVVSTHEGRSSLTQVVTLAIFGQQRDVGFLKNERSILSLDRIKP